MHLQCVFDCAFTFIRNVQPRRGVNMHTHFRHACASHLCRCLHTRVYTSSEATSLNADVWLKARAGFGIALRPLRQSAPSLACAMVASNKSSRTTSASSSTSFIEPNLHDATTASRFNLGSTCSSRDSTGTPRRCPVQVRSWTALCRRQWCST